MYPRLLTFTICAPPPPRAAAGKGFENATARNVQQPTINVNARRQHSSTSFVAVALVGLGRQHPKEYTAAADEGKGKRRGQKKKARADGRRGGCTQNHQRVSHVYLTHSGISRWKRINSPGMLVTLAHVWRQQASTLQQQPDTGWTSRLHYFRHGCVRVVTSSLPLGFAATPPHENKPPLHLIRVRRRRYAKVVAVGKSADTSHNQRPHHIPNERASTLFLTTAHHTHQ